MPRRKMDAKSPKAKFDLDTNLDSEVIDFVTARMESLLETLATLRFQTGDFAGPDSTPDLFFALII